MFSDVRQVIYCGTVITEEGKEKKVNIDFEPHKPVNTSLYLCDSRFHTEVCLSPFKFDTPAFERTFGIRFEVRFHCDGR
jgi:hypothetical protein